MAFMVKFCCKSIRAWLIGLALVEVLLNTVSICRYVAEIREIKPAATDFEVHEEHTLLFGFKLFTVSVILFVTATSPLLFIAEYSKNERILKTYCGIQIIYFGFAVSMLLMLTAIAVHFQGGLLTMSFGLHCVTVPVSLEVVNFGLTRVAEFGHKGQAQALEAETSSGTSLGSKKGSGVFIEKNPMAIQEQNSSDTSDD